jgi:hypothetical protein
VRQEGQVADHPQLAIQRHLLLGNSPHLQTGIGQSGKQED